jgi:hypothetical protein
VEALGIDEPHIEQAFAARLRALNTFDSARIPGFLIEGGFGTGKSHILKYLESMAAKRKLVSSFVTVSKETPIGDLPAVFRASVASLQYPDERVGGSLYSAFEFLDADSSDFARLSYEVSAERGGFDPLFAASLMLYERYRADHEIVEEIVAFWDGGPPPTVNWRRLLKEVDGAPQIRTTVPRALAMQRFRFVALALKAAGFTGWLISVDELELIAKFTILGRIQAYVSIGRLFAFADDADPHRAESRKFDNTIVVGTITDDLVGELLLTRGDREQLHEQAFRVTTDILEEALVGLDGLAAQSSRYAIGAEPDLESCYQKVRSLYLAAYSDGLLEEGLLAEARPGTRWRTIRQNVRSWISYWDLKRLDSSYQPDVRVDEIDYDLKEDADLDDESGSESE